MIKYIKNKDWCEIAKCKSIFVTWMWMITILSTLFATASTLAYRYGTHTTGIEKELTFQKEGVLILTKQYIELVHILNIRMNSVDSILIKLNTIEKKIRK